MTDGVVDAVRTHRRADARLCGTPVELSEGRAVVELETTTEMVADDLGLVHGGFVFGLADYAAMLAVNQPNVVLVAAESSFLRPVRQGERLRAAADVASSDGHRHRVAVVVLRGEESVFEGVFECAVTRRHVLEGRS